MKYFPKGEYPERMIPGASVRFEAHVGAEVRVLIGLVVLDRGIESLEDSRSVYFPTVGSFRLPTRELSVIYEKAEV